MPKKNNRISYEDRKIIESMCRKGKTREEIAVAIGFTVTSVFRELKRGGGYEQYDAETAQKRLFANN